MTNRGKKVTFDEAGFDNALGAILAQDIGHRVDEATIARIAAEGRAIIRRESGATKKVVVRKINGTTYFD